MRSLPELRAANIRLQQHIDAGVYSNRRHDAYDEMQEQANDLASYLTSVYRPRRSVTSSNSFNLWQLEACIYFPLRVLNAATVVLDGFCSSSAASKKYTTYFCNDLEKIRKATQAFNTLVTYFDSEDFKDQLNGGSATNTAGVLNDLLCHAVNSSFISRMELQEAQEDPRCRSIVRSRFLWRQCQQEEPGWENYAIKGFTDVVFDDESLVAFAKSNCLSSGHYYLGFNSADKFSVVAHEQGQLRPNKLRMPTDVLLRSLRTREDFRLLVCTFAMSDIPIGASITEYPKSVRRVAYLVCRYVERLRGENAMRVVKGFISVFSKEETASRAKAEVSKALELSKVIASVDAPRFERYRDKQHRTNTTFDYLTVDVSLLTCFGLQSLQVVKREQRRLCQLVMDRVSGDARMRDKPLLLKLLYVRELQVSGGGYIVTAIVDFKPGVENLLESASVSHMNLQ